MTNPAVPPPGGARKGETDVGPGGRTAVDEPRAETVGRRRGIAVATVLAAVLFGCALVVIQRMPTTYSATCVVSFGPRPTALLTADTVQLVSQKYVVVATSGETMKVAASMVGTTPAALTRSIIATLETGTGNVTITVERRNRQEAVDAANAVAGLLVRRAETDALVSGELTAPAMPSRVTTKPARDLLRGAAALAALLVGVLLATVLSGWLRPRTRPGPPRAHGIDTVPRAPDPRAAVAAAPAGGAPSR